MWEINGDENSCLMRNVSQENVSIAREILEKKNLIFEGSIFNCARAQFF